MTRGARCARFAAAALVTAIAACGGSGAGAGSGSDAAIGDAATGDGRPGGDASAGDGGGGADVLLPLVVGRTLTYQVAAVGAGSVCAAGTHVETVTAAVEVDGRDAFEVDGWCAAAGTATLTADGDKVELRFMDGWITVLDTPVTDGHMWTSTGPIRYTWREQGQVTVPAGTFDDCWMREQDVTYTAFTVFCRGVGAVRDFSQDLAGNGWDARLSAIDM